MRFKVHRLNKSLYGLYVLRKSRRPPHRKMWICVGMITGRINSQDVERHLKVRRNVL